MTRRLLFLVISIIAIIAVSIISIFNRKSSFQKPPKERIANDWFFTQRAYPYGKIDYEAYQEAVQQAIHDKKHNSVSLSKSGWEFAGPLNIGGRITDVEMHPSDMNTIYVGAAYGGVFKSGDAGSTWEPIFDDALSLSIGDLCIAPSNPEIVYVGTGEANAGGGTIAYDGLGVFKSLDAGKTWVHMGLAEGRNTGRLVVHPTNPDIVYVAVMGDLFGDNPERGIYKTVDGGNTWEQALYLNDSTGGIDIVINPLHPDTIYAAMWERIRRPNRMSNGGESCGIYRSYDGGSTWTELTNGLYNPADDTGRIGLDISQSSPNILYAIYADKDGYFAGIYKSSDNGDTWVRTNDDILSAMYSTYGWWFGKIHVDPVDPDIAYAMGLNIYKTSNGGGSWNNISTNNVHVDQHGIYTHPMNNNFVVLGNDGGINISTNQGASWSHVKTLPITQFYTCEVDFKYPNRLYGGTQDNGTIRTLTGASDDWTEIYEGDGFGVQVDPSDNKYVYAEYAGGYLARSVDGGNNFSYGTSGISSGDRCNWNTPYILDPSNPAIMYYGSQRIYKSENRAGFWVAISPDLTNGSANGNLTFGTITCIDASLLNSNIIVCGTDDGNISITNNGGTDWVNVSSALPNRWVTSVKTCPLSESTIYATISGYRFNESMSHVYKSDNLGNDWIDISSNLPNAPANEIIIDPDSIGNMYLATDIGIYYSNNNGSSWQLLGSDLPNVPILDIKLHKNGWSKFLLAATHGRGMYKYGLSSGANLPPTIETAELDTAYLNRAYSFYVHATDPENGTLAYSTEGLPTGLSINSNTGEISGIVVDEGVYHVTITVKDTELASSSITLELVAIDNEDVADKNSNLKINVFPNPCTGFITIVGSGDSRIFYQVFAVNGKIVKEGNTVMGKKIDVCDLHRGTYYLKTSANKESKVFSIVKL